MFTVFCFHSAQLFGSNIHKKFKNIGIVIKPGLESGLDSKSLKSKSESKSKSPTGKSESKSKSFMDKSKSKSKSCKSGLESGLESKSGLEYYMSDEDYYNNISEAFSLGMKVTLL